MRWKFLVTIGEKNPGQRKDRCFCFGGDLDRLIGTA
jgi:hypothetical protein